MKPILTYLGMIMFFASANAQNHNESELLNYISQNNGIQIGVNIAQIGNENLAIIEGSQINVMQTGDQQSFFYTETSILPSDLNVVIDGNNSYVEIFGNNQIINNMNLTIEGDFRDVTIRNYP